MEAVHPDSPEDTLRITKDKVFVAYRGSVAHNLFVQDSDPNSIDDIDVIGFAVGEPKHYLGLREWGSRGTKEEWVGRYDCVWYELRKAVSMLLQGNPNILSSLWVRPSEVIYMQEPGRELYASRNLFIGKHVYSSFTHYAQGQLQKMETREPAEVREYLGVTYELKRRGIHPTDQDLAEDLGDYTPCTDWSSEKLIQRLKHYQKKGKSLGYLGDKRKKLILQHGYDAKNAAHCIRLLKMCKEFLITGSLKVYRTSDRDVLLSIKAGKWAIAEVKQYANDLFNETREAYEKSILPEGPDRIAVEGLLIKLLHQHLIAC